MFPVTQLVLLIKRMHVRLFVYYLLQVGQTLNRETRFDLAWNILNTWPLLESPYLYISVAEGSNQQSV
jgi:hypothetical protein